MAVTRVEVQLNKMWSLRPFKGVIWGGRKSKRRQEVSGCWGQRWERGAGSSPSGSILKRTTTCCCCSTGLAVDQLSRSHLVDQLHGSHFGQWPGTQGNKGSEVTPLCLAHPNTFRTIVQLLHLKYLWLTLFSVRCSKFFYGRIKTFCLGENKLCQLVF